MQPSRAPDRQPNGFIAGVRRVDDAVFAIEKAIVITFLVAITFLIFIDVVYRRLVSPDSKIGAAIAAVGGVDDPATRAMIDAQVAPWVGAILGIILMWFAYWTAERHAGKRFLPLQQSALVLGIATATVIGFLGWLMLQPGVSSRAFYLILYGLMAAAWGTSLIRRRPAGWTRNLAILVLVITPLFALVAAYYMPQGYTWSQEVSGIMLLWVGFLGASICAHEGKHLRMEAFDRMVPPHLSRWIHAAGFLVTAAFCALMAWLGYEYVFDPEVGAYALGGVFEQTQIPDWIATAAVPVAFGLAMVRFLGATVSALLGGSYGLPPTEDTLEAARRAATEGEPAASAMDPERPSAPVQDAGPPAEPGEPTGGHPDTAGDDGEEGPR
jgi:TRAP-type C4-dicarboxylate transport system permease small subunit